MTNTFHSHAPFTARAAAPARAGLSVLEFIGCLMALVGGVWLGAIYLGVDMRHLAYVALSESKWLDTVPEEWRPADPSVGKAPTSAELAASVQNELVALRQEISALHDSRSAPADATIKSDDAESVATDATGLTSQATHHYWVRIVDIVHSQTSLQREAESVASDANATQVAAVKARICRFSASAIRALPTKQVDSAAVGLGRELADWFEKGADVYDRAVQIWESPVRGQADQQLTQAWEQAHAQLNNEGQLLNERVAAVRDSLTRRFGSGFAHLAAF